MQIYAIIGIAMISLMAVMMGFAITRVVGMFTGKKYIKEPDRFAPNPENSTHITGYMTGRTGIIDMTTRDGRSLNYTEYEFTYSVAGKEYTKWFNLFPGPDPGDVYEKDTEVALLVDRDAPDKFEVQYIGNCSENNENQE